MSAIKFADIYRFFRQAFTGHPAMDAFNALFECDFRTVFTTLKWQRQIS